MIQNGRPETCCLVTAALVGVFVMVSVFKIFLKITTNDSLTRIIWSKSTFALTIPFAIDGVDVAWRLSGLLPKSLVKSNVSVSFLSFG